MKMDVFIYSNATFIGGITVDRPLGLIVGGQCVDNRLVPPDTHVFLKKPENVVKKKKFIDLFSGGHNHDPPP
jgi:hypothetical protein